MVKEKVEKVEKEKVEKVENLKKENPEKTTTKEIIKDVEKSIKNKEKEINEKPELEREYIIPLKRQTLKVPRYQRANKAIKTIRQFLAKHMKVEDRDEKKVKINHYLNNEIWQRGIKKPPVRIKVIAKKISGIVYVELAEIPEKVKWDMQKDEKAKQVDEKLMKKVEKQEQEEQDIKEQRGHKETKEDKEREKSAEQQKLAKQEQQAKAQKHTTSPKNQKQIKQAETTHRKALKK